MSKRIANEKMAEEATKKKTDKENIETQDCLDKSEIEELVHREAMKFIELFHKFFYEFHENRIKKKEVSADAGLESTDRAISDIVSKIVARIRSLINLDKEVKKENREGSEHKKTIFLKVIDNFFQSFLFSYQKNTMARTRGGINALRKNIFNNRGFAAAKEFASAQIVIQLRLNLLTLYQGRCR